MPIHRSHDSPDEQMKLINTEPKIRDIPGLKWMCQSMRLKNIPGTLVNTKFWDGAQEQYRSEEIIFHTANTKHPFTQIQITDKGH